ncbi:hypothetical protein TNCV_4696581 [Trichonephila clavipes]|nr:hypothetical protein TNCV_4696581 [Trichonephila clavipes]
MPENKGVNGEDTLYKLLKYHLVKEVESALKPPFSILNHKVMAWVFLSRVRDVTGKHLRAARKTYRTSFLKRLASFCKVGCEMFIKDSFMPS